MSVSLSRLYLKTSRKPTSFLARSYIYFPEALFQQSTRVCLHVTISEAWNNKLEKRNLLIKPVLKKNR